MNAVTAQAMAGCHAPMLSLRVENPPVDIVEHAWQTLSNTPMPRKRSVAIWRRVSSA